MSRRISNIFTPTGRGMTKIRRPLTSGQHILHLLLTVLTAGLWLPVWIVRAWNGNVTYEEAARKEEN